MLTSGTAILREIDCEIDNVQAFYHKLYTIFWDEFSTNYISQIFLGHQSWEDVDRHELLYFLAVFIYCRSGLKKIQSYGTVNAHGFKRLIEKLGHFSLSCSTSITLEEVEAKLSCVQFCSQTDSLRDLQLLQNSITSLNSIVKEVPFVSSYSLILNRFVSRDYSSLDNSDAAYEAIKRDDVSCLDRFLQDNVNVTSVRQERVQKLILVLLHLSIICGSAGCVGRLLLLMKTMGEKDFTLKDFLPLIIVRILVKMSQQKLITGHLNQELTYIQALGSYTQACDDSRTLLSRVLSELGANVKAALLARDSPFRWKPLQYAAQHGLLEACQLLLSYMQDTKYDDGVSSSESVNWEVNWEDRLGNSPLRVAVTRGDDNMSKLLLEFYRREQPPEYETGNVSSGALLVDAIRSDPGILNNLLAAGANVNHQGPCGETPLYLAARSGDEQSVKLLLTHQASTAIAEKIRGWTPLIVASVEGHVRIAQLLINAGASQEYQDIFGWTAIDHAAFRGHITLAKSLREFQAESHTASGDLPRGRAASCRSVKPIRMPLNECLILVNLGSYDPCENLEAANLGPYLVSDEPNVKSELGLSIEICLVGKQTSSHTVDLPILEETVNKPWAFYTKDPDKAKLVFKVYRKDTIGPNPVSIHIGSGIALLNSLKQGLGSDRESLVRDYNIPILAKNSLEDIGTVTFSFLLVKPHLRPTSSTSARNVLWEKSGLTKVVGHRGMYSI